MSVARYPFSLTVHLKNGSQLFLDHAIHLNGEWEMCITQVCIPKSHITIFRDCFMTFNYDLQPKTPAKTEKDRLWNAKLRKLIFTIKLTISETTESTSVASYLDLLFIRDNSNNITTKLYDKRDTFVFHIVNFPFMSSNIPSASA